MFIWFFKPYLISLIVAIRYTVATMTNSTTANPIGAQSGAVIHHHDQLITLVNFNTRKVMNNRPKNPFPPIIVVFSFDITYLPLFLLFLS